VPSTRRAGATARPRVAPFLRAGRESWLRDRGIEPIRCDLLDTDALGRLPEVRNVVSMFAMKFGATARRLGPGHECVPARLVAGKYRRSRIIAFSTCNVYGLAPVQAGGSRESDPLSPVGEYAMSCLGRERILEHQSRTLGIPMALIRLNYAVEMRLWACRRHRATSGMLASPSTSRRVTSTSSGRRRQRRHSPGVRPPGQPTVGLQCHRGRRS